MGKILFLVKIQGFYILLRKTDQRSVFKFKPFKFLILGRKDLHTLPCFLLKCDHNHCICYNICFPFCMGLTFSYEQFQHISVFNLVFADFRSFYITSDYLIPCFFRFSSGKTFSNLEGSAFIIK